jgi:hypothetical protein
MAVGDSTSVNFADGPSVGLPIVKFADGSGVNDGAYVSQLFYSTDGSNFSALGAPRSFFSVASSSPRAGVWQTASLNFPPDVTPGLTLELKVAVWDANLFSDWASAVAERSSRLNIPGKLEEGDIFQLGITSAFNFTTPGVGDLNPADYNMTEFEGLTLTAYTAVPESSSIGFAAAVGLALLFIHRRLRSDQ